MESMKTENRKGDEMETSVQFHFPKVEAEIVTDPFYTKFVGKRLVVQGLNEPRVVEIQECYSLGKRHRAFRCKVVGDYSHFKDGDRENLGVESVIKNGQLVKKVRVLTA